MALTPVKGVCGQLAATLKKLMTLPTDDITFSEERLATHSLYDITIDDAAFGQV